VVLYPHAYFLCGFQSGLGHSSVVYRMHLQTLVWEQLTLGQIEEEENLVVPRDKFAAWVYKDRYEVLKVLYMLTSRQVKSIFLHREHSWDRI
jgi:hypothetical protein